jgi:hypothetical protein
MELLFRQWDLLHPLVEMGLNAKLGELAIFIAAAPWFLE